METDVTLERIERIGSDILTAFETGQVPHALAQILIRRKVEVPSKHWTWTNRLIGMVRGHVYAGGFRQWQALRRNVKKDERAFFILAPKIFIVKEDDPDHGFLAGERIVTGYRPVPVFGYTQTEGELLPGTEDEPAFIDGLPLISVARSWGLSISTYSLSDDPRQLGFFAPGQIGLATKNLSTWAHELVHAADHRLGTTTGKGLESEVVAEFGGAILLECLGYHVESDRGGAYEYVKAYCRDHNRRVLAVCTELLDRTCRCVAFLLDEAAGFAADCTTTDQVA